MAQNGVLSPAQRRAVAAIMATRTTTAAAAQADVLAVTTRAVLALTLSAVDTLKAAIDDLEAGHGVKVRAADLVLVHGGRWYELRTLEARLAALEAAALEVLKTK